ncbi:hypothetical protein KEM55_001386 [Ascosphaera atra]|nr:hypothetical protein KEM55_001386 [Ascosphaera atra]
MSLRASSRELFSPSSSSPRLKIKTKTTTNTSSSTSPSSQTYPRSILKNRDEGSPTNLTPSSPTRSSHGSESGQSKESKSSKTSKTSRTSKTSGPPQLEDYFKPEIEQIERVRKSSPQSSSSERRTKHKRESSEKSQSTPKSLEKAETFASLEPPMTYNQNKARLYIAIYHRNDLSTGRRRSMLGINAFRWAFIYATKDFSECYTLYMPSEPDTGSEDTVDVLRESIPRNRRLAVRFGRGVMATAGENFLGLVLLSKVPLDVSGQRITDELYKVPFTDTARSARWGNAAFATTAMQEVNESGGTYWSHTPASWFWSAVKRLRKWNKRIVPNTVEDLKARSLHFADKRLRAVEVVHSPLSMSTGTGTGTSSYDASRFSQKRARARAAKKGKKTKTQRVHWILNITDFGKPVAQPADLGDTWQKVLTRVFGEDTTIGVQERLRRLGLSKKQR